jgi:hypothetical protein
MHIKYNVTSAKFHFLHETLRREKERVSPWWNLWAQFHICVGNCVKPHWDTNRVSACNYAIKPYNEREVVGPLSLWNCAMKLCIERDIYFIPKFHILETGTVKLSIETTLRNFEVSNLNFYSLILPTQINLSYTSILLINLFFIPLPYTCSSPIAD